MDYAIFGLFQAIYIAATGWILFSVKEIGRNQKRDVADLHSKINNNEKETERRLVRLERATDVLQANYLTVCKDIGEIKSDVKTLIKRARIRDD